MIRPADEIVEIRAMSLEYGRCWRTSHSSSWSVILTTWSTWNFPSSSLINAVEIGRVKLFVDRVVLFRVHSSFPKAPWNVIAVVELRHLLRTPHNYPEQLQCSLRAKKEGVKNSDFRLLGIPFLSMKNNKKLNVSEKQWRFVEEKKYFLMYTNSASNKKRIF